MPKNKVYSQTSAPFLAILFSDDSVSYTGMAEKNVMAQIDAEYEALDASEAVMAELSRMGFHPELREA